MKYIVILVVVVALAGGGLFLYMNHAKAAAAAIPTIPTAKVERKDVRVSVQSNGAIASNRDVDIKCKASGNITVLPYGDVSAVVAPDALLMQLDTVDEVQALNSAKATVAADTAKLAEAKVNWEIAKLSLVTTTQKDQADLASAKAKAEDAHNKMNRTQALFDQKLAAKEDLETAQTTAASADADVQSAEAAIGVLEQDERTIETKKYEIAQIQAQLDQDTIKQTTAETNLSYCTVKSPKPDPGLENDPPQWRISKMTAGVAIGYLVQSGSSGASGGTTVMTLADMSHVYCLATVDESDIGRLLTRFDAGQELPVNLTADAYPGITFTGKVVRIATIGVNTSNVVTFEVKIEVTSPNRTLLRPIMTTNCDIISSERDNVLTVPVQAVSRHRAESTDSASTENSTTDATTLPAASAEPQGQPGGKKKGHKKHDATPDSVEKPTPGTVTLMKPDGSTESREVVVGLSDDTSYEIISGLEEGETVLLNKNGADSKWKGGRGGAGSMMRGLGR